MAKRLLPPTEYLRQRLAYNEATGQLTWLERPISDFGPETTRSRHLHGVWNKRFSGKEAGRVTCGRRFLRIDGVDYQASRVIWTMQTGVAPSGDVDHINGDQLDNRLSNLRDVSRSLNNRNRKAKPGISGYVGVTLHRPSGTWCARMWIDNKPVSLGYYKTPKAAFAARLDAQKKYGFTKRHMGQ